MKCFLGFLCSVFVWAGEVRAETDWIWHVRRAEADSVPYHHLEVRLGIRAKDSATIGRLGNFSMRGRFSPDLFDFHEPHPPQLDSVYLAPYEMTLTDAPGAFGWQLNAAYTGPDGEGSVVDTPGIPVVAFRFAVRNADGMSGFSIDSLQQTFRADNSTPAVVMPDTSGGNIPLALVPAGIHEMRVPGGFSLSSNFPNPFNSATRIGYRLPVGGFVRLVVYSLSGMVVRTLVESDRPSGTHHIVWDGTDDTGRPVSSGIYLLRADLGPASGARKMILVR